jgi:dienelactone hydrolase
MMPAMARGAWIAVMLGSAVAQAAPPCPSGAFLMREHGALVAAEWVSRDGNTVHVRAVANHALVTTLDITLQNERVAHVKQQSSVPGDVAGPAEERDYDASTVYWSDRNPVALELLLRATPSGRGTQHLEVASPKDKMTRAAVIDQSFPHAARVRVGARSYEAVLDEAGCLQSAILPAEGIVFERKNDFAADGYVAWPPYAAPPDGAYTAEDVRIPAPEGHVLAGTLTRPAGRRGRLPAVVCISGISKHERNHGRAPLHAFRDLADVLSRAGMVVLRVDDRGVGASTGSWEQSTSLTEAKDVHTEVAWLRARRDIDPARIALVGYSEGGLIAPIVAGEDPRIAAVVLLAGPGVNGTDLYFFQVEADVVRDPSVSLFDRWLAMARMLTIDDLSPREKLFLSLDPLDYAPRVRAPLLIVQGGSDLHVPPISAERLAAAVRGAGNRDVSVLIVPYISHILSPDPDGRASAWAHLPSYRPAEVVLHTVDDWLQTHLRIR